MCLITQIIQLHGRKTATGANPEPEKLKRDFLLLFPTIMRKLFPKLFYDLFHQNILSQLNPIVYNTWTSM